MHRVSARPRVGGLGKEIPTSNYAPSESEKDPGLQGEHANAPDETEKWSHVSVSVPVGPTCRLDSPGLS
jgi:hypothetical protein